MICPYVVTLLYVSSNFPKYTKVQGSLLCYAPHPALPQPQPPPQKVSELQPPYSIEFQVGEEKGGWWWSGADK